MCSNLHGCKICTEMHLSMFYGKNKNAVRINVRDIPLDNDDSELKDESGNEKEKVIKTINSIN